MAKAIAKFFKQPADAEKAVAELKSRGVEVAVIDKDADLAKELADTGLPEQALNYFKMGTSVGGRVVKAITDDDKAAEIDKLLLEIGHDRLVDRPSQWFTSPGFAKGIRMTATNPIDAQMTGDFRRY